ncbi:MAG: Na/Pi cotransporter family protein [Anaerovoracaceae bacterium]|nr:Na/Pi cotransporter family protein [Anaerovoracaceae bacterium]
MGEIIQTLFGLFGGLAIFIFGMNMMSESLQKVAGSKMKKVIGFLTMNPLMGVLAGVITTAVLQSSSATTVMVIGFVSAGLMTLKQGISVILGANIGTTMTAQLIAFKISDYVYLIVFIGFLIFFIAKSERIKNIGNSIFGFGLLFTGIETMSNVMKPLAASPVFTDLIAHVADIPVLGVLVGTLMTLVVQSSSATIAVLQNFASQAGPDGVSSIIGLAGAIPILLGDNIGTTITAILASIGQSRNAKRVALSHCMFNVSGALIFIWFVKPYAALIQAISPKGPEVEVISRQIANAHTCFNVTMTLLWLPLIWLLVKIVMTFIPEKSLERLNTRKPLYLDGNLILQPAAALEMTAREVIHCSDMVGELIPACAEAFKKGDSQELKELEEETKAIAGINDAIMNYLANLFSAGVLTEKQSAKAASLLSVMTEIDRINTQCRIMTQYAEEKNEKNYNYSESAMSDIAREMKSVGDMYENAVDMIRTGNTQHMETFMLAKDRITDLDIALRKAHMKRVKEGLCDSELTAPYTRILNVIDRISNCCLNIAESAKNDNVSFEDFLANDSDIDSEPDDEDEGGIVSGAAAGTV